MTEAISPRWKRIVFKPSGEALAGPSGRGLDGATLEATARALEAADPASFEHCKHVAALGMNARRVGKKAWVERAEAAQAEVFAARYLGPEGADDEERSRLVRELVERAEQSLDESSGEFCEA